LALDEGVSGNRGRVDHHAHVAARRLHVAEPVLDGGHEAAGGIGRGGGHLHDANGPRGGIDERGVGERPADVDTDAPHAHPAAPPRPARGAAVAASSTASVSGSTTTPYTVRARSADTLPCATSAATRTGSRVSGGSHPPPPGVWTLTTSPCLSWTVIFDGSARARGEAGVRMYRAGLASPPPQSPPRGKRALSDRIEKLGAWPGKV